MGHKRTLFEANNGMPRGAQSAKFGPNMEFWAERDNRYTVKKIESKCIDRMEK